MIFCIGTVLGRVVRAALTPILQSVQLWRLGEQPLAHQDTLSGKRVLIVEDEFLIAIEHESILAEAGADVVSLQATVKGALEFLEKNAIDAAVVDFCLLDRTSETLQEALAAKSLPFIVISAYPRVLVRKDERQAVLSKPVDPNLLCRTLCDEIAAQEGAAKARIV